jgi:hypothetical protein
MKSRTCKRSRLKIRLIHAPKIINGAKGTSLFIVSLFTFPAKGKRIYPKVIRRIEKTLPIQNASIIAENPIDAPRRSPIESPSFASPNPIARPLLRAHIRPKKQKIIGPANQSAIPPRLIIRTIKARTMDVYTRVLGIIVCLMS